MFQTELWLMDYGAYGVEVFFDGSKGKSKHIFSSESVAIDCLGYKVEKDLGVLKSNLLCVFSILLFAMGFPAAEYLLDDWDVVSVMTARNVFSFILIL